MRIGVVRYIQNLSGHTDDAVIYDDELDSAALAETLGFDTVWSTSHYFTPYQMTGNALQQATFVAGRTSRIDVGTMVVVLPWHHPLHIATEVCTLDHMLRGRRLILGTGRGAFRMELDAFGIPHAQSQARFLESLEILRLAIERERFSFDGSFFSIPETSIRPRPRNPRRLLEDMRVPWSGSSAPPVAARLGLDVLLAGGRRDAVLREAVRIHNHGRAAASRPILVLFAACTQSDSEGRDLVERHLAEFLAASERLAGTSRLRRLARRLFSTSPSLQVWGSPRRCLARLEALHAAVRPWEIVLAFRYGSMSREIAESSLRLFAREVLPVAQRW